MSASKPMPGKRFFTVEKANATLPLVRVIVRDIAELARDLRERYERMSGSRRNEALALSEAHREELEQAQARFEQGKAQMEEYERELKQLGVELKDYYTGLVDFPAWMDGHEVYLCWRLGEPEVAHWHEVKAGFAGRQPLSADVSTLPAP
jgi:hypothetical protein